MKPLGFVREGTRCAWNYDFGWSCLILELLPSNYANEIFVRVGLNLCWEEKGIYHFSYYLNGNSNQICVVRYGTELLEIEKLLNTKMLEIIQSDIIDKYLQFQNPEAAFDKTVVMLVDENHFKHTLYKDLINLAIFIDDTGKLANNLISKEEELEIDEKYRVKGFLTPIEAKAIRKELVDKINENRQQNLKVLSLKDYVAM